MSSFWSWFVIILVTLNIVGIVWLLFATAKKQPEDDAPEVGTTGHEWDGLTELNNPLPRWWFHLFLGTVIFSIGYLVLYPGMGNFAGTLNWTQTGEYQEELESTREQYAKVFAAYKNVKTEDLANNKEAMLTASRLFANNCSTCHGSDARGAKGFPNLADNDWLYGGKPEQIKYSIMHGRTGNMPSMSAAVGDESQVYNVALYVLSLSKGGKDKQRIAEGEKLFEVACVACHGNDAKGNQMLGAPNLTDDIWLHGSSVADIENMIYQGKQGAMPAQKDFLSEDEINLLTAYVYSLSKKS